MSYLNVTEIESALEGLARTHRDTCTLIELPEQTSEGRRCLALRIGRSAGVAVKGVLFTANAHAREWGGADCAVSFAADVLTKYASGQGVRYGGVDFTAEDVSRLVETMDVFVVPCANPDGRAYSQSQDPQWRKNRSSIAGTDAVGVDINRNFDFLWDSEKHFAPEVVPASSMGSSDPASSTFRGPSPHSEPETRNIVHLLDTYPNIGWLLDIHSYSGDVLHPWGDAANQSFRPEMNFRDPAFDGERGRDLPGSYREYLSGHDLGIMHDLATSVRLTIKDVRDQDYQVVQSFYLVPTGSTTKYTYPTGGTLDDYAFSRHLTDDGRAKVYGFTLEFGLRADFHPPWREMERIVLDVCAGMMDFCLAAGAPTSPFATIPAAPIKGSHDFDILTGIIDGGPGWILVGGKPIPVNPPDPFTRRLLQEVGYLQIGEYLGEKDRPRLRVESLNRIAELAVAEIEATT